MTFKEYIIEQEKKEEYTTYEYKLANRLTEFDVMTKYYKAISSERINILTFPYQYAFEEELIKVTNKPLNVFTAEWLQEKPKNRFIWALDFLKKHPESNVYHPVTKKGDVYKDVANASMAGLMNGRLVSPPHHNRPPITRRRLTADDDPDITDEQRAINNVKQEYVEPPKGYDVIDLDYVNSPGMENIQWSRYAWKLLTSKGVLLLTFALNKSQGYDNAQKEFLKKHDTMHTLKHGIDVLQKTPKSSHYQLDDSKSDKYGLAPRTPSVVSKCSDVLNNLIDLLCNRSGGLPIPVYSNMYQGGEGKGYIMGRIIFVKP